MWYVTWLRCQCGGLRPSIAELYAVDVMCSLSVCVIGQVNVSLGIVCDTVSVKMMVCDTCVCVCVYRPGAYVCTAYACTRVVRRVCHLHDFSCTPSNNLCNSISGTSATKQTQRNPCNATIASLKGARNLETKKRITEYTYISTHTFCICNRCSRTTKKNRATDATVNNRKQTA